MFYKLVNKFVRSFGFPHRGLKFFLRFMRFLGISNKIYTKKLPGKILIRLRPEEHIQKELFWYGYYEKPIGMILKSLLQPDSVFIDAGANIGYFSLLAARQSPVGSIMAFEPVSHLYQELKANVALNKFCNVTTVNLALGEQEENRLIYLSGQDNEGMSSFHKPENYSGKSEMVKVIPLDKWMMDSAIKKIDLIKIDTEGSELTVLKGMKEVIKRFEPLIVLELNPFTLSQFGLKPADVISYINELAYRIFMITEKGKLTTFESDDVDDIISLLLVPHAKIKLVSPLLE